jgi:hypothetical protein
MGGTLMGYQTFYQLTLCSDNKEDRERFLNITVPNASKHFLKNLCDGNLDTMKWYEWKEDMLAVSRQVPDIRFVLRGEGEGGADIWEAHFFNGKVCVCQGEIFIPEPDPNIENWESGQDEGTRLAGL